MGRLNECIVSDTVMMASSSCHYCGGHVRQGEDLVCKCNYFKSERSLVKNECGCACEKRRLRGIDEDVDISNGGFRNGYAS